MNKMHAARIVLKDLTQAKKLGKEIVKKKEIFLSWIRRHDNTKWEVEFLASCNKICEKEGIAKEIRSWLKTSKIKALAISVSKDIIFPRK